MATHSGEQKLLSLWPHLSVETKIKILQELEDGYIYNELLSLILEIDCETIRYLAAKKTILLDDGVEEKEILKKIESDTSDLVKYAQHERGFKFLDDKPEEFFSYPKAKQLAIVRGDLAPYGKGFSELIGFALTNANVEKQHIIDLLTEYVYNGNLKKLLTIWNEYDGYACYSTQKDLEALWELCVKLPEDLEVILVRNLPASVFGDPPYYEERIPEKVLEHLCKNHLLQFLLGRSDIKLNAYRKKVLFGDQFSDAERSAAASYNLDLDYDEFEKLLGMGEKCLEFIWNADLKIVFLEAAKDFIVNLGEGPSPTDWEILSRNIESRRKRLEKKQLKEEERELDIYETAKVLMPWKKDKPDEEKLKSLADSFKRDFLFVKTKLKDAVVPENTWKTFMNLEKLITGNHKMYKSFFENDSDFLSASESGKGDQDKRELSGRTVVWILFAFIIGYLLRGCG